MKRWSALITILLLVYSVAIAEDGVARYFVTEESDGDHVIVISQKASVREKATTGSKALDRPKFGTVMAITEDLDGWYGVVTEDGEWGYVRKAYVQKDYMYITFLQPTHIHMLPFDDVRDCIPVEKSIRQTFLVIGTYGDWLKVKLKNGIGYVKVTNDYSTYFQEEYSIFDEPFSITSYGTVYLLTDPYVSAKEDAARIGERNYESFTVIGYWDNFWVIQYGDGVALVDMNSPIITQMEVDYYYSKTPQYAVTAWDTEAGGRDGAGTVAVIPEGTTVEVLSIEEPWYIIKYEYQNVQSVAWISMYDTGGIIE